MKKQNADLENILNLIKSNWNIRPQKIKFIKNGDSTNNWKVISDNHTRFIFRNAGRYKHYVRFQCNILDYLSKNDFPYQIPIPIKTKRYDWVVDRNYGSFFLYKYLSGIILKKVTPKEAVQIGKMLATYHQFITSFRWQDYQQLRSKNLLDKKKMVKFIAKCKDTIVRKTNKTSIDRAFLGKINELKKFYLDIYENIDIFFYESLPKIPCHGDFDRRNILKTENRIIGFIDFGGITIDPQICDLQNCIQLNSMKNGMLDKPLIKSIIYGYISQYKLKKDQLKLILPLMYSEMLKTLCWTISELARPNSRVALTEVSERMKVLPWIKENYSALNNFFVKFSKKN